mmetsp:Transcript_4001/g.11150  ORF Transcript_4001/g.11150 Transcript_4001/m.11150 type:complete len:242 (-) Transcript_4001:2084-2809(-)
MSSCCPSTASHSASTLGGAAGCSCSRSAHISKWRSLAQAWAERLASSAPRSRCSASWAWSRRFSTRNCAVSPSRASVCTCPPTNPATSASSSRYRRSFGAVRRSAPFSCWHHCSVISSCSRRPLLCAVCSDKPCRRSSILTRRSLCLCIEASSRAARSALLRSRRCCSQRLCCSWRLRSAFSRSLQQSRPSASLACAARAASSTPRRSNSPCASRSRPESSPSSSRSLMHSDLASCSSTHF